MFSDFLAFYQVFQATKVPQIWLHALDVDALLNQYTQYLHGNPYRNRKVVLDTSLYAKIKDSKNPLQKPHLGKISETLSDGISTATLEAARQNERKILLLVFSHGALAIGASRNGKLCLGEKGAVTMETMKKWLGGKIDVTLMTNACFSGGWTTSKNFNHTVMTAA